MTWKSYTVVSGAGLLATWLVSTPTPPQDRPSSPTTAAVTAAQPSLDIVEQADRLRVRVRPETPYVEPARNPFRFGARSGPVPRATSSEPVASEPQPEAPIVAPVPEPPLIRLTGIATENVGGTRRRIAVLVTVQGILTVREGDPVGAEYRVSRIEDNAVELAAADGSTRRLALRQ